MKLFSKNQLVAEVMNPNQIINHINEENCYDKIVQFFQITSELEDYSDQISKLLPPIEGLVFLGLKSKKRKRSETNRMRTEAGLKDFLHEINRAGRNHHGHNRTDPGEKVCADKLYFGNTQTEYGSVLGSISITKVKDCKDEDTQKIMRKIIIDFVKSFRFDISWLTN